MTIMEDILKRLDNIEKKFETFYGNVSKKLEAFNTTAELLMMAMKGNPMNPSDDGISGAIKELRDELEKVDSRLITLEKFQQKIIQSWLVLLVLTSFVGAAIGLTMSLITVVKK